jgi:DNA polymerase III subunit gamma/tau
VSLDIKYRPRDYEDVLGQDATIAILKQYVAQGKGFRQSYLFCGGHGSGKTTLGRILARALLCEEPKEGEPCNECFSCKGMLENGTSADFMEVDAATKSGKADINAIKEEIQYDTFSGKRRIYLFDESHQLSKDALDALLKPLEDTLAGSEDKQLTCIFCTTEPEKMKATVLSRCAPAFVIQPQNPALIASRLQFICEQESITFEPEMVLLIAEITECHIRDALKAIEGVSMLGGVLKEHVDSYLHLDLNLAYLDLLDAIGADLPAALAAAKRIMERASPATCYGKLADVSMLAYRVFLGEKVPTYWGVERMETLGGTKGMKLLGYASRFANRPGRPTAAMLQMDIAHLHHVGGSVTNPGAIIQVQAVGGVAAVPPPKAAAPVKTETAADPSPKSTAVVVPPAESSDDPGMVGVAEQDVLWVEARRGPASVKRSLKGVDDDKGSKRSTALKPKQFAELLSRTLSDLGSSSGGLA